MKRIWMHMVVCLAVSGSLLGGVAFAQDTDPARTEILELAGKIGHLDLRDSTNAADVAVLALLTPARDYTNAVKTFRVVGAVFGLYLSECDALLQQGRYAHAHRELRLLQDQLAAGVELLHAKPSVPSESKLFHAESWKITLRTLRIDRLGDGFDPAGTLRKLKKDGADARTLVEAKAALFRALAIASSVEVVLQGLVAGPAFLEREGGLVRYNRMIDVYQDDMLSQYPWEEALNGWRWDKTAENLPSYQVIFLHPDVGYQYNFSGDWGELRPTLYMEVIGCGFWKWEKEEGVCTGEASWPVIAGSVVLSHAYDEDGDSQLGYGAMLHVGRHVTAGVTWADGGDASLLVGFEVTSWLKSKYDKFESAKKSVLGN